MPGLLDLPPELLENVANYLLQPSDRAHLASLRLSCRQVEEAIRRPFRLKYFRSVTIRKPKDEDIQKFCAVNKVSDLAKSIKSIAISCADDGTAELVAQQRNVLLSRRDGRELLWPSGTEQLLVPTALISHKEALLEAFLATKNLEDLRFMDYHLLESTIDGNKWKFSADLPAPRRMQTRATATTLYSYNHVCDITSTFNFIMSLVARAGLAPKRISIPYLGIRNIATGLPSAVGLVACKEILLQLESLQLVFADELRDKSSSAEAAGTLIGQQLSECLDSLPMLKILRLCFTESEIGTHLWELFAQGSVLPALQELSICQCKVAFKDVSQFILKHRNTLTELELGFVDLDDGSLEDVKGFLDKLRDFPRIEYLHLMLLRLDGKRIGFPLAPQAWGVDLRGEEEYVLVVKSTRHHVRLDGTQEINDGLMVLADRIVFT